MLGQSNVIQGIISGIGLVAFYSFAFWRIARRNAGNRVIETGSLAAVVFALLLAVFKIPGLPDWVAPGLGMLFLLLGFLMIFFLLQQGYNAIRRKRRG